MALLIDVSLVTVRAEILSIIFVRDICVVHLKDNVCM